jgi:methyltransferase
VSLVTLILALVAAERLIELVHAARNTRALKRRGAIERGAGHYPLLMLLHASWLAALFVVVPRDTVPDWPLLVLYLGLQGLRLWVIRSLGPYWTTRIITLPGEGLVRRGPYRFLRHPNYVIVTAEIAVLPLVFHAYAVALIFSALNLAILAWRIRIEEGALAGRT